MQGNGLASKVHKILKAHFPEDTVDVAEQGKDIHVLVVSRRFDGLGMQQSQDLLDALLEKSLSTKDWRRISLVMGVSPEYVRGVC